MKSSNHATLEDILVALREKLIAYNDAKDYRALSNLFVTFETLLEGLSWHYRDKSSYGDDLAVYRIIETLSECAQDGASGVPWKSVIPPPEEIKAAFLSKD